MFAFLVALLLGSALLNLPAWLFARGRNEASWWLPLIGAPGILAWLALVAAGVGPQSLSNAVEAIGLGAASLLLCYAQVFVLNPRYPDFRRTSAVLVVALIGLAVLLRLSMPLLPE